MSAVVASAAVVREAETLADKSASGTDRFMAAVALERQLAANPHKALLLRALVKKRTGAFDGMLDRLQTELFITGGAPPLGVPGVRFWHAL